MTTGDAFDDFARSRWGDLEPVAQLVVLDTDVARDVTTAALARLARDWSRTTEEGRPVEQARRLVLRSAVDRAVTPGVPGSAGSAGTVVSTGSAVSSGPGPDDAAAAADPVREALVAHLRGLDPLARALVATGHVWGADPHEVAVLLDRPSADVRQADAHIRHGLEDAHAAARAAAGHGPAPWALDHDLRSALDLLVTELGAAGPPPDPAELVDRRSRSVRRRTLVVGGVATAAVGGLGAAVSLGRGAATPAVRPLPAATDRVWFSTSQWPVRGPLAADPGLPAFRAQRLEPADRILWVGDAGTRRVVVASTTSREDFGPGTSVRLFTGPKGAALATLAEVTPEWGHVEATDAVVAAVPDGPEESTPRTVVLAVAKPTDALASWSAVVRPTTRGDLTRTWEPLPVREGIAVTVLPRGATPSLRVRIASFEGPPVSPVPPFAVLDRLDEGDPVERIEDFVTAMTDLAAPSLDTRLVSDDEVPSRLFTELGRADGAPPARVRRYVTTTPDGSVLRTALYLEPENREVNPLEVAMVVPTDEVDRPGLAWGAQPTPGTSRFLVLHQPAATVQLVTQDGVIRSPEVPARGRRATTVDVVATEFQTDLYVVLRDGGGDVLYQGPPVQGRWLFDG